MNRPRCREWLPLSTQQMRLRNLVRISGVNIGCGGHLEGALVYYTLHHSMAGEAFYCSEPLAQRHSQLKWAEIACADMLKSNANCVCVKIWACSAGDRIHCPRTAVTLRPPAVANEIREPISALSVEMARAGLHPPCELQRPSDRLLFTWGVYFSGLVLLSQHADAKCRANSLLFQINGDLFGSPERFTAEGLREQSKLSYARYSASVPRPSQTPSDAFAINSPQSSRSSSPVQHDWPTDLLRMARTRYAQLNCARQEVRRSYSLAQLLRLQELQRRHLQKERQSHDFAADIRQLSVSCITADQVQSQAHKRRRTTSGPLHHLPQHHSMGRALSVLLAEQQQVSPHQLLQAQRLQRECETLRARHRLLVAERGTYAARSHGLHRRLQAIASAREQLEQSLGARRDELGAEQEQLREWQVANAAQAEVRRHIVLHMERRMSALCMELGEIYPIERGPFSGGLYTLCGVAFPDVVDSLCSMDPATQARSAAALEHVSPTSLSVALGFLAHLVQMIAVVLNHPLRNPILHEGSRSRIRDMIKDIPYASREFPLYSRAGLLPKAVRYAIFLLNQNIAQLCFDITGRRCDLSSTVRNVLSIFSGLASFEQQHRSPPRSRRACSGGAAEEEEVEKPTTVPTAVGYRAGRSGLYGGRLRASTIATDGVDGGDEGCHSADDCIFKSSSSDINHLAGNLSALSPPGSLASVSAGKTAMTRAQAVALFQVIPGSPGSQPVAIGERPATNRVCRSAGSYADDEEEGCGAFHHIAGPRRSLLQGHSNSDSNLPRRVHKSNGHA